MKKINIKILIIGCVILFFCLNSFKMEDKKVILVGKIVALNVEENIGETERIDGKIPTNIKNFGVMTCINLKTNKFVSFCHGMFYNNQLPSVENGACYEAYNLNIEKSSESPIGKIHAQINYDNQIGKLEENTNQGVYGKITNNIFENENLIFDVASSFEVVPGEAEIYIDLDGKGLKKYSIEIEGTNYLSDIQNIYLRITDEELLEKVGGIIKGMSGTPIVQNGKLVGAINYTSAEDFTRGTGIFASKLF